MIMLKASKKLICILMLFLININFMYAKPAFAVEAESEKVAVYRTTLASNPLCAAINEHTKYIGIAGFTAGIALIIASIPVFATGHWIIGLIMVGSAFTSIAVAITRATSFFACNWAFVRHPVMRFDDFDVKKTEKTTTNTNNITVGAYKECAEPEGKYPDCADNDIGLEEEYFRCIATEKRDGTDAFSLKAAKDKEPTCHSRKFKKTDKYSWPKNRVSSSSYIEVCYRNPIGISNPFTMVKNIGKAISGDIDALLRSGSYPREADYGDSQIKRAKYALQGSVECKVLRAGQEATIHTITFRAIEKADKICVHAVKGGGAPLWPHAEIGCHMRPGGPPAPMCDKSEAIKSETGKIIDYDNSKCYSCYIDDACTGKVGAYVKSIFPVTSTIVACIKGSLNNILNGTCSAGRDNKSQKVGFLKVAQEKLKKAVMAVLILALILFAIKAALGGIQSPAELYMLIIKFSLVVYFTQGNAMSHYYDQLVKLSIGLSDIVLSAGGKQSICDYKESDYPKGYEYIAPWDRLDCRLLFYLGQQLIGGPATVLLGLFITAGMFFATMLFNVKMMLCLVAIFAVLMLLFIVIWLVYIFLLSLIALTILILISPLMIPMVLFQATKGFFDGWIRQLMVYSLYPVILFGFLALLFTVFDNLYFEDLEFERHEVTIIDAKRITFKLKNPNQCDGSKYDYNLACMFGNMKFLSQPAFLGFNAYAPDFRHEAEMLWTKLLMMVLIGFLFYHFLSSISYIAAELAGDPRAGHVGASLSPKAMMGSAVNLAAKVQGAGFNKARDAISNKLGNNKSGGDGGKDEISSGSSRSSGASDSSS
ncbi:conjugal transfer protein TrbL [Ehrlichia ruminantium]|nr:conjugal transfer protein TrbL [Ehrlichia ruminantium]